MNKNTPRQLTVDEARERLIIHFWHLIDYWEKTGDYADGFGGMKTHTQRDRLEGLVHSILAALDGCTLMVPTMELKPIVSDEDIDFYKNEPYDPKFPIPRQWYPPDEDIGGALHEILFAIGRKHGYVKD